MDFSNLIRDAWQMTWRHRFLWVLGLFAAGTSGGCSMNFTNSFPSFSGAGTPGSSGGLGTSPFGPSSRGGAPTVRNLPDVAALTTSALQWVELNAGKIIAVVVLVLLLGVVLFVVSLIAQGAMARATADVARGRPVSLRIAWRAGLRLFWRYLGLTLLLLAVGLAIVAVAAGGALATFLASLTGESTARVAIPLAGLLFVVGALLAVALGIALTIVVAFAQRSIAVHDAGPLVALYEGAQLLRRSFGTSLLLWLVSLAVGVGAGIVLLLGMGVLAVPLVIIGITVYAAAGLTAPLIVYLVLAAFLYIAMVWCAGAVLNTFQWSYWTLAYLRLTGDLPATA